MIPNPQYHPEADPVTTRPRSSRRATRSASASRALAMLNLIPIHAIPVQRVHVSPRQPDGTLRVLDRPTGQHVLIYTPRYTEQFQGGHRAGKWYVRPVLYVGVKPQSRPYATAREAIEAVSAGTWNLSAPQAPGRRGSRALRVIWN